MSNNKQSSLEFILNNIHLKDSLKWPEIIQQAKAMHKEEIERAFNEGEKFLEKTVALSKVSSYL